MPYWDPPIETMRFMLEIATTSAKQTKNGAGQSILQYRGKSSPSTPQSREGYKEMQTRTGKVLDGWVNQRTQLVLPVC